MIHEPGSIPYSFYRQEGVGKGSFWQKVHCSGKITFLRARQGLSLLGYYLTSADHVIPG